LGCAAGFAAGAGLDFEEREGEIESRIFAKIFFSMSRVKRFKLAESLSFAIPDLRRPFPRIRRLTSS
jgi:hypothetical protein